MVTFRNTNSEHPVFELGGKNSRFFLPKNEIRTARLYIVLQNLVEAQPLYHKHSIHL